MRRKHRTFVPRIVFGTVFAGVVPACVLGACGGGTTSAQDAGHLPAVAQAFDGPSGVADASFADHRDSGQLGVADAGFGDATDTGNDTGNVMDAPSEQGQGMDVIFAVAFIGFVGPMDRSLEGRARRSPGHVRARARGRSTRRGVRG